DPTIMNSATCASCVEILTSYVNFGTTCEGTEEKINLYCKILQNKAIIKLSNVLTFLSKGVEYNSVTIKKECTSDNLDYSFKWPHVKEEVGLLESKEKCKREKVEMYKSERFQSQIEPRSNIKGNLLNPKDISEAQMFKCEICEYQTKRKNCLKRHLLSHNMPKLKCEMCQYQTSHRGNFNKHLIIHKDITESTMFKCNLCEYQARHRHYLKRHLQSHKDASEVQMFKCKMCEYETRCKPSLKRHLLGHKDISEVEIFRCEMCDFHTRHRLNLNLHLKRHSKRQLCAQESFRGANSKYKLSLQRHLLHHKDISEVQMFNCEMCEYQTRHMRNLKRHLLTHKDISEVQMYKCEMCEYQTKRSDCLKSHLLVHKVRIFKCEICEYQTKQKKALKKASTKTQGYFRSDNVKICENIFMITPPDLIQIYIYKELIIKRNSMISLFFKGFDQYKSYLLLVKINALEHIFISKQPKEKSCLYTFSKKNSNEHLKPIYILLYVLSKHQLGGVNGLNDNNLPQIQFLLIYAIY
ncbi:hypothetical protein NQ317_007911, partial [Molorchus minor]